MIAAYTIDLNNRLDFVAAHEVISTRYEDG